MNVTNATELDFAAALARLTAEGIPKEQQDLLAAQLLAAFVQKCMAVQLLSSERRQLKKLLGDLQLTVGNGLAASMKEPVRASGQFAVRASPQVLNPDHQDGGR